jgi:hypothetical protein
VLLGNVLRCNRIRQEEERVIYIYSNKIRQEHRQATEAERNTRGCLAKEERRKKENERRERKSFGILITYKRLMQHEVMKPKNR